MKFDHLIVPLDGSQLAEAALPAASHLAQAVKARVTLLHVIERNAPEEVHGQSHLADVSAAHAYLKGIAAKDFPPDIRVEEHVHSDKVTDVTDSLVKHIQELQADLIVMCSHGRGGLNIRLFGSIPQRVLALGTTPVLLIHPSKSFMNPEFSCQKLLVPLDGNPEHEQSIPIAIELAKACQAEVHLIMVVYTRRTLPGEKAATATLLPGATEAALDIKEEDAQKYLNQQKSHLKSSGLMVTEEVQRGDPTQSIILSARQHKADLIVIGTHGKTGMDAFWSNSLTPKIASRTHLPLLLVPVGSQN